ncbi:hypothetical protein ACTFIV_009013 [Dictyostelium citrinum]
MGFFNRSCNGSRFPNGPLIFPLIGSLYTLNFNYPYISFKKLSDRYGKVFSLKMGSIDTIIINDINFLQKAFRDNPNNFSQRYPLQSFYFLGYHKDVLFGNGQCWRKMKNILISSLSKSKFYSIEDIINQEYFKFQEYLIYKINKNNIINFGPIFKRVSINVLLGFIFGVSFDYDDNFLSKDSFVESYNIIFEHLAKQPADFIPLLKPFNTYHVIEKEYKKCINFFQPFIEKVLKKIDRENPKCFLDYFIIQVEKDTSDSIKIEYIPYVCFDIIVAGTVTTSTTMDWMLLYLTNYPDIQERLFNEINIPSYPNFKDKSQFQYFNSIFKETLRLSPPAPFALPHLCSEDIVIDDILIPKNSQIISNLYGCNRNNFEDCDSFNPDRFLNSQLSQSNNRSLSTIASFSFGLRSCPGGNTAEALLFLITTKLYKSFKFERISNQLNNEKGIITKSLTPHQFFTKVLKR